MSELLYGNLSRDLFARLENRQKFLKIASLYYWGSKEFYIKKNSLVLIIGISMWLHPHVW